MSGRSLLVLLLALIALAAVAYFAFGTSPTTTPDEAHDEHAGGADPSPWDGPTTDTTAKMREEAPGSPPPVRTDEAAPESTAPAATQATDPARASAPPSAPAVEQTRYLPPERVVMGSVRWVDLPGTDAVDLILRETGLRLDATEQARKILKRARVNLEMEGRRASYVLGMVLLPHSLGYTVRDDRLLIFVEDD